MCAAFLAETRLILLRRHATGREAIGAVEYSTSTRTDVARFGVARSRELRRVHLRSAKELWRADTPKAGGLVFTNRRTARPQSRPVRPKARFNLHPAVGRAARCGGLPTAPDRIRGRRRARRAPFEEAQQRQATRPPCDAVRSGFTRRVNGFESAAFASCERFREAKKRSTAGLIESDASS